jgi:hypothetical protein
VDEGYRLMLFTQGWSRWAETRENPLAARLALKKNAMGKSRSGKNVALALDLREIDAMRNEESNHGAPSFQTETPPRAAKQKKKGMILAIVIRPKIMKDDRFRPYRSDLAARIGCFTSSEHTLKIRRRIA